MGVIKSYPLTVVEEVIDILLKQSMGNASVAAGQPDVEIEEWEFRSVVR